MQNVTGRRANPFDLEPDCESFVPGFGDPNAHFHVVGDHPGVHGGIESGVPFTDTESGEHLQRALVAGGLLKKAGSPPTVDRTFLSYLHMCVPEGVPRPEDYAKLEPFFDTEVRAITAHVLLPVGERATRHVLENFTAVPPTDVDMDALHGTEIHGSGWLVYPIKEPLDWTDDDERRLVDALEKLLASDYRREADLGRFLHNGDPYFVR